MALLETRGLVKKYSGRAVVDGVSVAIGQRTIVGLLGRNGAGKTTSFRMIMGMITPNAGQVLFQDRDVTKLPMYKRARLGIGYLSQEPSIFQRLPRPSETAKLICSLSVSRFARSLAAREGSSPAASEESLKSPGLW